MADSFLYAKLRGRIKEKFGTESRFAQALGVTIVTVSRKLSGKSEFSRLDIKKWCEALEIPTEEVGTYFFA